MTDLLSELRALVESLRTESRSGGGWDVYGHGVEHGMCRAADLLEDIIAKYEKQADD